MHKTLVILTSILSIIFLTSGVFLLFSSPTQSAFSSFEQSNEIAVLGVHEEIDFEDAFDVVVPEINKFPQSQATKEIVLLPEKISNAQEPNIYFGKAAVVDSKSGKIIYSKNANIQNSIASITKLMTALVFMDNNPGWELEYTLKDTDRVNGGKIYLYTGDIVKIKDLFYLSLVGSANTATKALVNSTGLGEEEFIAAMNEKAIELNLGNTFFADPVGLSYKNVSTAYEVAKLAKAALSIPEISQAVLSEEYRFETVQGKNRVVYNTDSLLESFPINDIMLLGGKTGYTESAGYCFVGKFQNENGDEIFSVILGGDDINYRFQKTRELTEWTYNNFEWK